MSDYEYRLNPDDPAVVQVRRVNHKRIGGGRGEGWRTYYVGSSPGDAQRILGLLNEPQTEGMWTP